MTNSGLYLHIPFCRKKCAYCDFYSAFPSDSLQDDYLKALIEEIKKWGGFYNRPIDSVYIGGGTPSLLGERIIPLMKAAKESLNILDDAEITAEANPAENLSEFLSCAKKAGVNRLSLGVQSADDSELSLLGRSHSANEAANSFQLARSLGFENISLDLMIGLPNSNKEKLKKSLDFIAKLNPEHISAYILKIEPNTAFYAKDVCLPDDDEVASQYLYMCEYFKACGYARYEISNFSKTGFESRHNLKYWEGCEYLGLGPAAHSFIDGKRFFYPRDLRAFLKNPETLPDGEGGSNQEKLMLELRLKKGIDVLDFTENLSETLKKALEALKEQGLINLSGSKVSLTDSGCLVSNSIINYLTELIYEDL